MAEWRRKLQEILDDAERRDGRVRRRGGRPGRKSENGVVEANGGKNAGGAAVTCETGTLRKEVADGVDSGNGGADNSNGGKNAGGAAVTCETGTLRKGVADGVDSGNGEADNSNGGKIANGAAGEKRVTQMALVLALEAVSEPLWALVKSVGTGGGAQSA